MKSLFFQGLVFLVVLTGLAPSLGGQTLLPGWQSVHAIENDQLDADFDGDGLTNRDEALFGSNPRDRAAAPIPTVVRNEGGLHAQWPTSRGVRYQVEVSADLSGWGPLGSTVLGTGGIVSVALEPPGARQFLRIRSVPHVDTDMDGLFDPDEYLLGSYPGNPDSDANGITDYQEFLAHTHPAGPEQAVLAINCGGGALTGGDGTAYTAEAGFVANDGNNGTISVGRPIANTVDDTLYQSIRYGDGQYRLAVANGGYDVTLKWAECFVTGPGQRLFHVTMEGQRRLTSFDVYAEAGGMDRAMDRTFRVYVGDGELNVLFTRAPDNAIIAGLLIKPVTNFADSDDDSLPDEWEMARFSNLSSGAGTDTDGDGLAALQEYVLHTDPLNADTDSDGMDDGWEAGHTGLKPLSNDRQLDRNADGIINIYEYFNRMLNANEQPATPPLVHRYSFGETSGSTVADSAGGAHGVIRGAGAVFGGGQLTLPGGSQASAAYADLPNQMMSRFAALNGGTGKVSVEGWATVTGAQPWSRMFDFGANDGGSGGELFGPGDANGGGSGGQNFLVLIACDGSNPNQRSVGFANGASTTFATSTFNTEFHFVFTFDESAGIYRYYENGVQKVNATTTTLLSSLNDVNNWLGRSNYTTDANLQGSLNEFRIYGGVLNEFQIQASHAAGPDADPMLDSDLDSMPDIYENSLAFLDKDDGADAGLDFDGDGMSNGQEYQNGFDPTVAHAPTVDADSDGMPDVWEVQGGLNPRSDDSFGDADGDRYPNIFEYAKGTSPQDRLGFPGPTFVVNRAGGGTHTTIKAAVEAHTQPYDIIMLRPGTYAVSQQSTDPFIVWQTNRPPLLIIAEEGPDTTIIDGENTYATSIRFDNMHVAISGVRFTRFVGNGTVLPLEGPKSRVSECVFDRNHKGTFNSSNLIKTATAADIVNCIFHENTQASGWAEQALLRAEGTMIMRVDHCTFVGNSLLNPAVYSRDSARTVVTNSIFWGNGSVAPLRRNGLPQILRVSDCIVQGGFTAPNIQDIDPLTLRDGHLTAISPARGKAMSPSRVPMDVDKEARISAASDLGADQYIDSDSDGMADQWERRWFGDLTRAATGDAENDGLTNFIEYSVGTTPTDADSDDDLLPDAWEVAQGLDPLTAAGLGVLASDADGDGLTLYQESLANTAPNQPDTDNDGIGDGLAFLLGGGGTADFDGDGLTNSQEASAGLNPFSSDTDRDGANDSVDFYPLDPGHSAPPAGDPQDLTAPTITLLEPVGAVPY